MTPPTTTNKTGTPSSLNNEQARIDYAVQIVRAISNQAQPNDMIQVFGQAMREWFKTDGWLSISRRGLAEPYFRITRSSRWDEKLNPWTQRDQLPLLKGGLLAELAYGNEPRIIHDITVDPNDPAHEYLQGYSSIMAVPHFDQGEGLNVGISLGKGAHAFDHVDFPERILINNLFGRATNNLVTAQRLREAHAALDREFRVVGDIQRSLLPKSLPDVPGLKLAAYYQTAQRAGGDYYDFFPLAENRWGLFVADVSGHGTPAAVVMAVTHAIAHTFPGERQRPDHVMPHLNRTLHQHYIHGTPTFVTAFYAVYDADARTLTYTNAGHNPPRLLRDGRVQSIEGAASLPLGIEPDETFTAETLELCAGDELILYTDGLTEALNDANQQLGTPRFDALIQNHTGDPADKAKAILNGVTRFAGGRETFDDQTLVVAQVQA